MKIIRPIHSLCSSIASSNIAQPNALWLVGTTYAIGDIVRVDDCGSILYESLTASNLGNDPETTPLDWLPIGVSNYFAMFDEKNGTQTESLDTIEVVINFTQVVNSLALVNMDALSVTFQVWNSGDDWTIDTPVLDETVSMRDYGVSSWYEYATYQIVAKKNYVNFDFPTFIGGIGRLLVDYTGSTAKLGSLIYGNQLDLGHSLYGAGVGIKDYSTKEVDLFGNYQIVERGYRDVISDSVFVGNSRTREIKDVLAYYRATPLLWSADETLEALIAYGFYTNFDMTITSPAGSNLSLTIESI